MLCFFVLKFHCMLEIHLLGTGGTVPLPGRWLTSLLLRWEGKELLVDCGEGTQIALHSLSLSCRHIDTILLTHYHADHTLGLPGLLLSMAKADRTEPVTIVGPAGLKDFLQGVMAMARYVPFEIRYIELNEREVSFNIDDLQVSAFFLRHSVPCYGYCFNLERKPKFDVEAAKKNQVPLKYWSALQKGETIEADGVTYTPDLVMGQARKGLKVVYATDTRINPLLRQYSQKADLLITEGMYGDPEKKEKAQDNRHMMMQEAANLAKDNEVKELWLTHYSPSMKDPYIYTEEIQKIFPHTILAHDGQFTDLAFDHEEESPCLK